MISSNNSSQTTLANPYEIDLEKKGSREEDELKLNKVERVLSIPVAGPFGSSSPGALPPTHSLEQALEEQLELEEQDRIRCEKGEADWEVRFVEGDPENPLNWSSSKRWYLCGLSGLLVFNSSFSSSAPSGILPLMSRELALSSEVSVLVISLFVAGYVIGPLFWGPLSEVYGRRNLIVISFVLYVACQVGSALSSNIPSVLIFRLLGGIMASSPLVITGSLLGDIFPSETRGMAIAIFVLAPLSGPALGPICSGFMYDSNVEWTWLFWVLCLFGTFCLILAYFTLPETYAPVLLVRKAERLRKKTGEPWFAPLERKQTGFKARANDVFVRPFAMLVQEPMLAAITLYMSVVYGILYLTFVSYPIIFGEGGHGFTAGPSGLMFLPLFFGSLLASILSVVYYNPKYVKETAAYLPGMAPPELRLSAALVGGPFLVVSVFWLAFTSFPSIHWAVPMMSGLFLGASLVLIFLPLMNFIVDAYLFAAATALAANTVCRSLAGAIFPLFGKQLYAALNPRFAGLALGLVCLVLMPIPLLLIRFGPKLRARSQNAGR
ncbi:major facilitator superfamily domain-containing protein [Mrakia frigida]|uniref:MFS transporter n=1 Tax=Mrakia frigida TaxID=29902 RepID=UPI003FCC0E86